MKSAVGIVLFPVMLLCTGPILAQEVREGQGEPSPRTDKRNPSDEGGRDEEIRFLKDQLSSQQKTIDGLVLENLEQKRRTEEIASFIEEQSMEHEMSTTAEDELFSLERLLRIYGFMDVTFTKAFMKEDSSYNIVLPPYSTFIMSNINLFVTSQMTESLGATVELHFSFLPHGQENSYETTIITPDATIQSGLAYDRTMNIVVDPLTVTYFQQHGVTIERAHFTYTPRDWFNILAGRFLTPYGIWNIDHGSNVVIPARIPYMQTRGIVPHAQNGVMFYGRAFALDRLAIDYSVSVSNGRGPVDALVDLDENKGVGARLKLTYSGDDFRISLGGYGYFGTYTDVKKTITMYASDDLTMDTEVDRPMRTNLTKTEEYDEYILTADLEVDLFGFHLQSEYVWRYVDYKIHGPRMMDAQILSGASPFSTAYNASFIGNGVYVLAAWELPLAKWIRPVRIRPYFMYEYAASDDTMKFTNFNIFIVGVNLKPSPYVSLKLDYSHSIPQSEIYGEDAEALSAQLAVSF